MEVIIIYGLPTAIDDDTWNACMKILNDKGLIGIGAKQDLRSTREYNLRHELPLLIHFGNGNFIQLARQT
jgi:hypothetical protein